MSEESKMKSSLYRTLCALVLCMLLFVLKFILKEEDIVTQVYNYLSTDIVFLK